MEGVRKLMPMLVTDLATCSEELNKVSDELRRRKQLQHPFVGILSVIIPAVFYTISPNILTGLSIPAFGYTYVHFVKEVFELEEKRAIMEREKRAYHIELCDLGNYSKGYKPLTDKFDNPSEVYEEFNRRCIKTNYYEYASRSKNELFVEKYWKFNERTGEYRCEDRYNPTFSLNNDNIVFF